MGYNMTSMCHDIDFRLPLVKSGEYYEHWHNIRGYNGHLNILREHNILAANWRSDWGMNTGPKLDPLTASIWQHISAIFTAGIPKLYFAHLNHTLNINILANTTAKSYLFMAYSPAWNGSSISLVFCTLTTILAPHNWCKYKASVVSYLHNIYPLFNPEIWCHAPCVCHFCMVEQIFKDVQQHLCLNLAVLCAPEALMQMERE